MLLRWFKVGGRGSILFIKIIFEIDYEFGIKRIIDIYTFLYNTEYIRQII